MPLNISFSRLLLLSIPYEHEMERDGKMYWRILFLLDSIHKSWLISFAQEHGGGSVMVESRCCEVEGRINAGTLGKNLSIAFCAMYRLVFF
ncbi:hypothetical protein TNCT_327101 [Trichonephila clavata]|uniref:Uncharacterized protein n=1 Tax=Trichonephila clavata TaxID=2740835 RepID=A0A8X6LGU2_TRICU|nr:hypothetical protein TNCT_327101 [Trichonephila clavata]